MSRLSKSRDRTTDHESAAAPPAIANAFYHLVNAGRASPLFTENSASLQNTTVAPIEHNPGQMHGVGVQSEQVNVEYAISSSMDFSAEAEHPEPALSSSHRFHEKPAHFSRPNLCNESPSTGFSYAKAEKPIYNTKPCRGPAAAIPITNLEKCQTEPGTAIGESNSESPQNGVENVATEPEDTLSRESESESSRPQDVEHQDQGPSPMELSDPGPVSNIQACEGGRRTTVSAGEPLSQNLYPAPVHRVDVGTGEQSRPNTATAANMTDDIGQGNVSMIQKSLEENRDDHCDEEIDTLDGPTLVEAARSPLASARNTSNCSSSSLNVTSEEPGSEDRHGNDGDERCCRTTAAPVEPNPQAAEESGEHVRELRHGSSTPPAAAQTQCNAAQPMDSEELLKALAIKLQHQKQQKGEFEAREQTREREMQDLETLVRALHQQLQESEERVATQESDLAKYRRVQHEWRDRGKKLGKFVNGLANDHGRLRDVAQDIQTEQRDLRAQKDCIDQLLKDTVGSLQHERLQHRELITKARSETKMLEQALNSRNLDLLNESTKLRAEQHRGARLQEILAKSTSSYEGLTAQLVQHEAAIRTRMVNLYEIIESTVGNSLLHNQEDLSSKLQECLTLLKETRTGAYANADDLKGLNVLVNENNTE